MSNTHPAWYSVVIFAVWASVVQAQPAGSTGATASAGVGLRGPGETAACCGPYQATLDRARSVWFGGGVFRWVVPRVAVEVEGTWAREPSYTAYVQGRFGDAPYAAYGAENEIRTMVLAGLVRGRAAMLGHAALDVVGGFGWARQAAASRLTSVVFRPGPNPAPELAFEVDDTRHVAAAIIGVDIGGRAFGSGVELFATARMHRHLGGPDEVRTDLALGRTVWRLGAGLRRTF